RGQVTRAEPFGAFVQLAPGVEGLIHISELGANRQLRHARDAVKPGDALEVVVLALEPDKRRISLGLATGEQRVYDEGRAAAPRAATTRRPACRRRCSTPPARAAICWSRRTPVRARRSRSAARWPIRCWRWTRRTFLMARTRSGW